MKEIRTLIKDIYGVIDSGSWFTEHISQGFVGELDRRLVETVNSPQKGATLRLSKMGPICPRALWFSIHSPTLAEPLPPWAKIKYLYGHILEALVISMAKAAGHEVVGEQDELSVDGVIGHRDCVIDGCVVDVKSSSTRGFQKFKDGSIGTSDDFGYLDQLDGYLLGSLDDPLVRNKRTGYLLAIDKTLGHMVLYEHQLRQASITERIKEYKDIVSRDEAPACTCKSIPDGKSGNLRLDMRASYSPFKYCCRPSLRTFLYADGPRYLTHIERLPDVPELTREGKIKQ